MDENLRDARALSSDKSVRSISMIGPRTETDRSISATNAHTRAHTLRSAASGPQLHLRIHSDSTTTLPLGSISAHSTHPQNVSQGPGLPVLGRSAIDSNAPSARWTANSLRGTRSTESLAHSKQNIRIVTGHDSRLRTLAETSPTKAQPSAAVASGAAAAGSKTGTSTPDRASPLTSDLQHQMAELKGRISLLRDRARSDSLRRASRSSGSGNSPSLLTDASALGTVDKDMVSAGLNQSASLLMPQPRSQMQAQDGSSGGTERSVPSLGTTNGRHLAFEALSKTKDSRMTTNTADHNDHNRAGPNWSPTTSSTHNQATPTLSNGHESTSSRFLNRAHFRNTSQGTVVLSPPRARVASIRGSIVRAPIEGSVSGSIYGDCESEAASRRSASPTPNPRRHHDRLERHEDRPDAFDYQHYFLQSRDPIQSLDPTRVHDPSETGSVNSEDTAREHDGVATSSRLQIYTPGMSPPQAQTRSNGHLGHGPSTAASGLSSLGHDLFDNTSGPAISEPYGSMVPELDATPAHSRAQPPRMHSVDSIVSSTSTSSFQTAAEGGRSADSSPVRAVFRRTPDHAVDNGSERGASIMNPADERTPTKTTFTFSTVGTEHSSDGPTRDRAVPSRPLIDAATLSDLGHNDGMLVSMLVESLQRACRQLAAAHHPQPVADNANQIENGDSVENYEAAPVTNEQGRILRARIQDATSVLNGIGRLER